MKISINMKKGFTGVSFDGHPEEYHIFEELYNRVKDDIDPDIEEDSDLDPDDAVPENNHGI